MVHFDILNPWNYVWIIGCLDLGDCKLLTSNICGGVPREVRFKSRTIDPHFILFETWSISNINDKSSKKVPTNPTYIDYLQYSKYKEFYKVACINIFGQNWESNSKRLKFEFWEKLELIQYCSRRVLNLYRY